MPCCKQLRKDVANPGFLRKMIYKWWIVHIYVRLLKGIQLLGETLVFTIHVRGNPGFHVSDAQIKAADLFDRGLCAEMRCGQVSLIFYGGQRWG